MRLLQCLDCLTLEEVPDFAGMPDDDVLLDDLVRRHRFPNSEPHKGNLFAIDSADWRSHKDEICKRIWEDCGYTGLEPEFYASKSTYHEDALRCFSRHDRPVGYCIDWHDKSKRLGNPLLSWDDRRAADKHGLRNRQEVFLCDFCPVASHVTTQKRLKAGLYDE